ncbi:MAG TPA: META domain-containing protein [Deinococcales bacterium]|nr:META domain-containing protein [Deinococcales bacterium]
MTPRLPLAFGTTILLSSCTLFGGGPSLPGGTWRLTALTAAGGPVAVPAANAPTLEFRDGRVTGTTGCNQYSGPAVLKDARLTLGPIAATRAACLDPTGTAVETAYLDDLNAVNAYSQTGDNLILTTSGPGRLEFTKANP